MVRTIGALLAAAGAADPDARRDAEVLLCHLLDKRRSYVFAFPEHELAESALARFDALWQRRMDGEPLAYITGIKEFWSLELAVSPHTLVPRPDTEVLVQAALDRMGVAPLRALDLGTGSGAIALALAVERPGWTVIATDIDKQSVDLARRNAERNRITNVEFFCGSWFEPVADERFDLIVSNPPYIADNDPLLNSHGVRREPTRALVSGTDGLDDIRHIVRAALRHLNPAAWLMLEHGHTQAAAVRALLSGVGLQQAVTIQDFGGLDRVSIARREPS